jgi:hypothetical protein
MGDRLAADAGVSGAPVHSAGCGGRAGDWAELAPGRRHQVCRLYRGGPVGSSANIPRCAHTFVAKNDDIF